MNGATTGFAKWSYPWYEDLRDGNEVFEELFCRYSTSASFGHTGASHRINVEFVSGNYFQGLGIDAGAGRVITPDDDRIPNGHPVAVLSHGFWKDRFDSDETAVGQEIRLNGRVFEVFGVGPVGFRGVAFDEPAQVFVPMAMKPALSFGSRASYDLEKRRNRWVHILGRLKPAITHGAADAALEPLFRSLVEFDLEQPELAKAGEFGRERYRQAQLDVEPGAQGIFGGRDETETALTTLIAMVGLLLLIGCANVANLLMARGVARSKEIAVRVSIGAGRFRVVRQLMAESLLLALAAGAVALVISTWTMTFTVWLIRSELYRDVIQTTPDLRIVLFTLAVALATAILFGLMPAVQSARAGIAQMLKDPVGSLSGGSLGLRKAFVAFQVFLSVVLLVGAGLFVQTLENLRGIETGFKTEETLVFGLEPGKSGYGIESGRAFLDTLSQRLGSLPGVDGAAYSMVRVLEGSVWNSNATADSYKVEPGEDVDVNQNAVSPGYFATLGISLLEGRNFRASDGADSPQVGIVNKAFADYFFAGESPIGRKFAFGGTPTIEIVELVPDFAYERVRGDNRRQAFVPFTQMDGALDAHVPVRGDMPPEQLMAPARRILRELDGNIPIFDMNTLDDELDRSLTSMRIIATLGGAFGVMATLLSGVGLYGVLAFSMARRRREIGLRIALGAQQRDIAGLAVKELAVLFAVGAIAAVPVSLGLGKLIETQLYEVSAFDPATIVGAVVALTVVAVAASFLLAWRAARIQPMTALRFE